MRREERVKRFIVGGKAKIDGSFDERQETVAQIAVFILGLAPGSRANANAACLRLHWLCVFIINRPSECPSILLVVRGMLKLMTLSDSMECCWPATGARRSRSKLIEIIKPTAPTMLSVQNRFVLLPLHWDFVLFCPLSIFFPHFSILSVSSF